MLRVILRRFLAGAIVVLAGASLLAGCTTSSPRGTFTIEGTVTRITAINSRVHTVTLNDIRVISADGQAKTWFNQPGNNVIFANAYKAEADTEAIYSNADRITKIPLAGLVNRRVQFNGGLYAGQERHNQLRPAFTEAFISPSP